MQRKRLAFLLVGACAFVVSCDSYAPPAESPPPSGAGAALVFETRSAERTLDDCVAGAPECTYIRFDHPNVVDPRAELAKGAQAVTDAVQTFLSKPLRPDEEPGTPRALFDRFITEAQAANRPVPWFLERNAFVLRSTPRLVSLGFVERSFLGGAHALETYQFQSFDVVTGEKLRLSDIVSETRQEELRLLAERAFRKVRGLEPDADLTEAGFAFDEDRFTLTENFAIDDDGLSFYYNHDEIAPYSQGATEVRLGYEELDGLLTPLVTDVR